MKRFRMKKQKVVKPDGRWMYLYTFEEEGEPPSQSPEQQHNTRSDLGNRGEQDTASSG